MEINKKIQDKFRDVKPTEEAKKEIKKAKEDEKLTIEKAIELLPDKKYIHTFRQGAVNMVIGADWNRGGLIETMRKFEDSLILSGKVARSMDHGIALHDDVGVLFIETDPDVLEEYAPV